MGDLLWQDLHDQLAQHQGRNVQNDRPGKRSRAGTTPGIDLYNDDDGEDGQDLDNRNMTGDDGESYYSRVTCVSGRWEDADLSLSCSSFLMLCSR